MATFTKLALQPAGTTGTGLGIKVAATATAAQRFILRHPLLQRLMKFGCTQSIHLLRMLS